MAGARPRDAGRRAPARVLCVFLASVSWTCNCEVCLSPGHIRVYGILGIVCCAPRAVNKTIYNQKNRRTELGGSEDGLSDATAREIESRVCPLPRSLPPTEHTAPPWALEAATEREHQVEDRSALNVVLGRLLIVRHLLACGCEVWELLSWRLRLPRRAVALRMAACSLRLVAGNG